MSPLSEGILSPPGIVSPPGNFVPPSKSMCVLAGVSFLAEIAR